MTWTALFSDLEAQGDELARAERAGEAAEAGRIYVGTGSISDRLRGCGSAPVRLWLRGDSQISGVVERTGPDWLLVSEGTGREAIVLSAAVLSCAGLSRYTSAPGRDERTEMRLRLPHMLRGVSRDRSSVRVCVVDGSMLAGTIDRVGSDYLELATTAGSATRRQADVREFRAVPLAAVAAVRRELR
ncbi:MAG: hypothetical protein QOE97_1984 [Pseudonocardiales bacterium]|nr:hypothetical protein [Pseudonocardiales bacterium]